MNLVDRRFLLSRPAFAAWSAARLGGRMWRSFLQSFESKLRSQKPLLAGWTHTHTASHPASFVSGAALLARPSDK